MHFEPNSFLGSQYFFSASKDIPHLLWNLEFHFQVRSSPPFVSLLNNINPLYIDPSSLFKVHLNITLASTPISSMSSLFAVSQTSYFMYVPFLTFVLLTPELQFKSRFTSVTVFKSNILQPVSFLPHVSSFELPCYSQGATERNGDTRQ
jgi:hypothetical protein